MILEGLILQKASAEASGASGVDTEKEARIIAQCSDAQPDFHNHIIDPRLLEKFAKSLDTEQLPFLADHRFSTQNLMGRSIRGYTEGEGDAMKAFGEWSIPKTSSKPIIKDFLEGVENGLYNAVSVGLTVKEARCTICKKHAFISRTAKKWSEYCLDHYPGREYKGKKALWNLVDGRLLEVSNVVKGANHNAKIKEEAHALSMQVEGLESFLKDADFDAVLPFMDDIHTVAKSQLMRDGKTPTFFLPTAPPRRTENKGETDVELDEMQQALAKIHGRAGTLVKDLSPEPLKALEEVVSELAATQEAKAAVGATVAEYKAKAEKFDRYLDALIEAATKSGVEAEGDAFNKEAWEKILKGYDDPELIATQKEKWDKEKKGTLPEGDGPQVLTDADGNPTKIQSDFDDSGAFTV